jgi:putative endonuclease
MEGVYVYLLICGDGSFYAGSARSPERRVRQHMEGSSRCRYTRSHQPVRLACCWQVGGSWGDALRVERLLKGLTHSQKEGLAANPELLPELAVARLGVQVESWPAVSADNPG